MPFWTYILRCADGTYYTGHTDDLERRIAEHHSGAVGGHTSTRRPVELVWAEEFDEREAAKAAEVRVKDWSRVEKEALIAGGEARRLQFSKPPGERAKGLAGARRSPSLRSGKRAGTESPLLAPPLSRAERGAPSSRARTTNAPAIVLVRPQLAENIGKAARAMLNFGLTDLRLVSPRDGWPNPDAGPAASGADVVIDQAQLFESVAEAVADCAHVYATTVRKRDVIKPVVDPAQAAFAMRAEAGRSAVLFGPERAGLETDDVALARTILTVPVNPNFGSLNLAQAVILVAYEWSRHEALVQPPRAELAPPAPQADLEGMIAQLETMLDDAHYFFPHDKAPVMRRGLRSILTKPGWNAGEVRTLRGVLTTLARQRASKASNS